MASKKKTMIRKTKKTGQEGKFGEGLAFGDLYELTTELYELRLAPPEKQQDERLGEILRFVRGLRFSARLIYFLRERLSSEPNYEVSWGHLIDENGSFCSPECDIIIHEKGHVKRWNGNEHPIMDFRFVRAKSAKAIISCKAALASIDVKYPKKLKQFGIRKVFLFAESCKHDQVRKLQNAARRAGYSGLWFLYLTRTDEPGISRDTSMYDALIRAVLSVLKK